jgi:hypothetical protein
VRALVIADDRYRGCRPGAVSPQLGLLYEPGVVEQPELRGRATYYLCTSLGLALLDGES